MPRKSYREFICRQVIKEVIEELQRGAKPWIPTWLGGDDPRNHKTLRLYTGMNSLLLWAARCARGFTHDRWLTVRQAETMGGLIRESDSGTTITFAIRYHTSREDRRAMREGRLAGSFGCARTYVVFNVAQISGLPPIAEPPTVSEPPTAKLEVLVKSLRINVQHGGAEAHYRADTDTIQMPDRWRFLADAHDPVYLHEIAHAVAGPHRLDLTFPGREKAEQRALSEIAAELTSAALYRYLDLGASNIRHSAAFIHHWLEVLRSIRRVVNADPLWVLEVMRDVRRMTRHLVRHLP